MKKLRKINVWGDGKQTRSFMFIDDCIKGILKIFYSDYSKPINLGSSEKVSINKMINIVEKIAKYKIKKNYQLNKPKGVRGRSSDNSLIKKLLNWEPKTKLVDGLGITYNWIFLNIKTNKKSNKFIK